MYRWSTGIIPQLEIFHTNTSLVPKATPINRRCNSVVLNTNSSSLSLSHSEGKKKKKKKEKKREKERIVSSIFFSK
jgi:hypothetical protein